MTFIIVCIIIAVLVAGIAKQKPENRHRTTGRNQSRPSPTINLTPNVKPRKVTLDLSLNESETKVPKYFVFDVETTGLPRDYDAKASDLGNWPRVVQIAWMVLDNEYKLIDHQSHIIKPYRYRISNEVAAIHGITYERAKMEGKPHSQVYPLFLEHLHGCDTVVAHNATFDVPIVEADLIRWNFGASIIGQKRVVCTMRSGTNFCAIPKPLSRSYKYPKLSELYFCLCAPKLKDAEMEGLHDAEFDVLLTVKCLEGLSNWRIPLIEPKMKL